MKPIVRDSEIISVFLSMPKCERREMQKKGCFISVELMKFEDGTMVPSLGFAPQWSLKKTLIELKKQKYYFFRFRTHFGQTLAWHKNVSFRNCCHTHFMIDLHILIRERWSLFRFNNTTHACHVWDRFKYGLPSMSMTLKTRTQAWCCMRSGFFMTTMIRCEKKITIMIAIVMDLEKILEGLYWLDPGAAF